jgi:ABC-2 type transport system permease protein
MKQFEWLVMILRIAHKEFIEMARDGRFRAVAGVVLALLIVSLAVGWKHYREVKADREAAQAQAYEQWLNQGQRNPHSAAHYGMYAFKPMLPLALLDRGVEAYTGSAVFLEAHKQNEFRLRPAKDTAGVARFSELTAAMLLQLIAPLVIILLAFGAFAGEREAGTLRQLLSLGISRRALGAGKALGVAGVLALLMVPAAVIGVAALAFSTADRTLFHGFNRAALLALAYLLYFAVTLLVSIAVSARLRSSRLALLALLAFWIGAGLIAPRTAADLAKWFYPTPSTISFSREMEKEILQSEQGRHEKLKQRVLAEHGVSRVEDLPFNFEGLDLQDSEEYGNAVIDRHYGAIESAFAAQTRAQALAALISPFQAVRLLSMGLAGTDPAQQRDFARACEEYRRMMVKKMNEAVMHNEGEMDPNYFGTQALSRKTGREMWQTIPPFTYDAPGALWVLRNHRCSALLLVAWLVVAALAAWRAVTRLSVE